MFLNYQSKVSCQRCSTGLSPFRLLPSVPGTSAPPFSSLISQDICLFCLCLQSRDSVIYDRCFVNFLIYQMHFDLRGITVFVCLSVSCDKYLIVLSVFLY